MEQTKKYEPQQHLSTAQIAELVDAGMSSAEIQSYVSEFLGDAESINIKEPLIKQYIWRRFASHKASAQSGITKKTIQYIVIGTSITDFGQQKLYNDGQKLFLLDKHESISKQVTDKDGNPLHQKGYLKGKPMKAVDGKIWNLTKQLTILWREGNTADFKIGVMSQRINREMNPRWKTFTLLEGEVGVLPQGQMIYTMDPLAVNPLSDDEIRELFKRSGITLTQIGEQLDTYAKQQHDFNDFCVVYVDPIGEGVNMDSEKTDRINVINPGEDKQTTVWIAKNNIEIPRNLSPLAIGLYIVGRASWNTERSQASINALGMWVDPTYLITDDNDEETTPPSAQISEEYV